MAIQHDQPVERMSLEAFFALVERDPEHRYEFIDGFPSMMTGGSPDHSIIGLNVASVLRELLRKRSCIAYNSDVYIALDDEENCLCPDASVSCDRRDHHATNVIRYPCVVAEVLSPSTKVRDRGLKADLYQNMPSVQEMPFIDTQVMKVQLYRSETDYWTMRNFTQNDTIELTSLGVHFSVAEVYEKSTFDDSFTEET